MNISVITPSYNQAEFIAETIRSVWAQDVQPLEHLIFDGGSNDGTVDILQTQPPSVRWWSEPDGGQAHAVNKGLQQARGEIIAWINSDDIYYPGAFAAVLRAFAQHPDADVVYGSADHIDKASVAFEPYPTAAWDPELLRRTCFLCQPAVFFQRRALERVGTLNEQLRYCMDYEFWLRLSDAGCRFVQVDDKLAGSRLYDENKTLSDRAAVHREIADMFKAKDGHVPLKWIFAYCHHKLSGELSHANHPRLFRYRLYLETLKAQWHWNRRTGVTALRELRREIGRRHRPMVSLPAASRGIG
ncbi:MAG: glycosyltransferase [Cyanobacteria bacterium K_DeepCast_35m_m2_023]|nr:glycosyltransferase [Cyanobacteria bacterium K_DeepCast_35m_m2_023]